VTSHATRLLLGLLSVPVRLGADRAALAAPPPEVRLAAVSPAERLPRAHAAGRWLVAPAAGAERALELLARVLGDLDAGAWAEGPAGTGWEGLLVPVAGGLVLVPAAGAGALAAADDEEVALATRLVSTLPVRVAPREGEEPGDGHGEGVVLDLAAARAARAARGVPSAGGARRQG
jgi:hypothetical protein